MESDKKPPIVFKIVKHETKQERWRRKNWDAYLANQREYLKKWRAARGKG